MLKEKELIEKQLELLRTQQSVVDDIVFELMERRSMHTNLRLALAKLSGITVYLHNLIQDELNQ
jgi:hypothetical protein